MKKWTRILLSALTALSLFSVPVSVQAEESTQSSIRILFTHDLHDHILPYKTETDGKVSEIGGYARLKTAVDTYRTDTSILVDAGDFSMGTLFNGIFAEDAPDLNLLSDIGYDAVTLGNHEFDYGPELLADMLDQAVNAPTVLSANIQFSDDADSQKLKAAFDAKGSDCMIIERGGIKIGLFGVMGDESISDISVPGSVTFEDEITAAQSAVQKLKDQGAQFIVCLSHSGTNTDASKSEDQILAKKVDGINVIISGHSHTTLDEPIIENNTVIVSSGCYGKYLGVLDVSTDGTVQNYQLVAIDGSLKEDADIQETIKGYEEDVQTGFLDEYGYQMDETIAHSSFSFGDLQNDYGAFGNSNLADLIADSYVSAYKEVNGDSSTAIGITAKGIIRDNLYQGDVTIQDAYNLVSLGSGNDGIIGYPLATAYVYGHELRTICEIDASVGRLREDMQMYFSGMKYTYSDSRVILNRVQDVYVQDADGNWSIIDENKLYPVVCNYYMALMMPAASDMSYGLLSIHIRDASGNVIEDTSSIIMHDTNGLEIKEWSAFIDYLQSFEKNSSGVSEIPASYKTARDCKTAEGFSLTKYFQHTTTVGWIVYGVIALVILIIVLIVHGVRKHRRKKREKMQMRTDS